MSSHSPFGTRTNRRRFLAAAGISALALPLARPLLAQAKITCRIAHSEAVGSPMTLAFDKFTAVLRDKSGGRIDAQHFPAGQLGSYTQLIEQSRIGTIQITAGGPDTEEAVAPEIAVAAGAPGFMYKDEAHADRVLTGPIANDISAIARAKTGVEFVAYGEVGFRHLLSKKPVTKLEDLKGLKIRTPELKLWLDFWRKLGANPTPLPYAEQYSALSTGVIDALEADYFSILGFKWYEQAKNLTLTGHWFLPKAVRVNAKWLDGLPPDLQTLVRDSAKEIFAEQRALNRAKASEALAQLEKSGVNVIRLSAAEQQRWMAATAPLFDEFGGKSPETKAMIVKIVALRG
ncbi:MAG: TRAP transporter substrate-binding protein [Betaproteobacteria bacterium]|nr:TRAP transporter substrate-binding protein [Betaproteobacteria bacterium]MBA3775033.1 TRAP transporter substrate-binding protein [Betaproteobacteria bacterium]